ncbi:MAG: E3 binding domain-containing protein [Phycisphaerales bacterium]
MAVDIIIPEMGESVRTGVVSRWAVADGDVVKRDQLLMELETDKITAEITATAAGRVKQLVKVGETVPVGAVVARIEEGAAGAAPAAAPSPAAPAAVEAKPAPAPKAAPQPAAPAATNGHAADVRATPLAEKIAKEQGIDLSQIQGTGPGGRIREQDVTGFTQNRAAATAAVATAPARAQPPRPLPPRPPPPPAHAAAAASVSPRSATALRSAWSRRSTPPPCSPPTTRWT